MKKAAINFRINPVYLFLFLLLTLIATTSFGQDEVEYLTPEKFASMDLKAQPYGEETLVDFDMFFNDKGALVLNVRNEDYLGTALFLEHKRGKTKNLSYDFFELSGVDADPADTTVWISYELNTKIDRNDIFLKTTAGVTSLSVIREGKLFYITLNGKLIDVWDKDKVYANLNGKSEDFFKNKIDWQYDRDSLEGRVYTATIPTPAPTL